MNDLIQYFTGFRLRGGITLNTRKTLSKSTTEHYLVGIYP